MKSNVEEGQRQIWYANLNIPPHCLDTHHPFQAVSRHDEPKEAQYSMLSALRKLFIIQEMNRSNRNKKYRERMMGRRRALEDMTEIPASQLLIKKIYLLHSQLGQLQVHIVAAHVNKQQQGLYHQQYWQRELVQ